MNLDQFVDNSRNIAKIESYVVSDEDFNNFCILLNLKQNEIMSYKKSRDRVFRAIKTWMKAICTMDEFIDIINKYSSSLAKELNILKSTKKGPIDNYRNLIFKQLTSYQKEMILARIPKFDDAPGYLATVAQGGFSTFWAEISNSGQEFDPKIWKDFPYCLQALGLTDNNNIQSSGFNGSSNNFSNTSPASNFGSSISLNSSNSSNFGSTTTTSTTTNGGKVGNAFAKLRSKKELTVRDFFSEKDGIHANAARDLIKHLDESGYWEQLMAFEGLMEDDAIAAEVVKWKFDWKKSEISATKRMLEELLPTEWGNDLMKNFAREKILANTKCPNEVKKVMDTWLTKIDGKEKDSIDAGTNRYENANTLNTFFIEQVNHDNIFKVEDITLLVERLQDDCITTTASLNKLVKSRTDILKKDYNLKTGQIFAIEEALDKVYPPK